MKEKRQGKRKRHTDILFGIASFIAIIFAFIPLILRNKCIHSIVSCFLGPLGEYGSSYIETLGAFLGTFLAITGALWTQRKIDKAKDEKELQESALIVYYDFEFAFADIIKFMNDYLSRKEVSHKKSFNFNIFKEQKEKNHIYIYIDDNWIHTVAKLSSSLKYDEIQKIYKLYGDLSTIKRAFNSSVNEMSQDDAKSAYSVMVSDFCSKKNTEQIMKKLKELSGLK